MPAKIEMKEIIVTKQSSYWPFIYISIDMIIMLSSWIGLVCSVLNFHGLILILKIKKLNDSVERRTISTHVILI